MEKCELRIEGFLRPAKLSCKYQGRIKVEKDDLKMFWIFVIYNSSKIVRKYKKWFLHNC